MDRTPSPGRRSSGLTIAPVCVGWLGSALQARRLGDQLLCALRQAQAQHPQQAPPLLIATSDFTHAVSCSCCRRQAVGSGSAARSSAAGWCAGAVVCISPHVHAPRGLRPRLAATDVGTTYTSCTILMCWQGAAYNEPPDAPWMSLREHCVWRDSPLLHAVCMGELLLEQSSANVSNKPWILVAACVHAAGTAHLLGRLGQLRECAAEW